MPILEFTLCQTKRINKLEYNHSAIFSLIITNTMSSNAFVHALSGNASKLRIMATPSPVRIYSPVTLPSPKRPVDLQLRVTSPATGTNLPIILISHGHGPSNWLSSLHGYSPLAEYYAAHGFVVLQPTHLTSRTLSIEKPARGNEMYWASRAEDMSQILNHLETIEDDVPELKGRLDKDKVAVVGHSFGGLTASMLLGATNTDPRDSSKINAFDDRIKAGVIIGGLGNGGEDLSEGAKAMLPFYGLDFGSMHTKALVVAGDEDISPHLTVRDETWHVDPYTLSPGPKDLYMIKGGKHTFGGISGWDAAEIQEDAANCPEMLGVMQKVTWAWLRSALYGDNTWEGVRDTLKGLGVGNVQSKA